MRLESKKNSTIQFSLFYLYIFLLKANVTVNKQQQERLGINYELNNENFVYFY